MMERNMIQEIGGDEGWVGLSCGRRKEREGRNFNSV